MRMRAQPTRKCKRLRHHVPGGSADGRLYKAERGGPRSQTPSRCMADMVARVLILAASLLVGGLAQSPIYQAGTQYPAYQVYQPGTDRARYLPFPSEYQVFDPRYQTFGYHFTGVSSDASQYQVDPLYQQVQIQHQVDNQYQASAQVYQPVQPQYQAGVPVYQPSQLLPQSAQPQHQVDVPVYQPSHPEPVQPDPVQPQYQPDPVQPQYQPEPVQPQYQPEPQPTPSSQPQYTPISSQYQSSDESGQYTFGFTGADASRTETRNADGSVRGSFSYVDDAGKTQTQYYIADSRGFRVSGTNLPKPPQDPAYTDSVPYPQVVALPTPAPVQDTPEVAAAKAAFIKAYNAAAIAAAQAPDID